ncbi:unnamed protein product [Heligmosomoides polygyrus]|uniref:Uncharacterized protein n=1 Tax=Heligmosomoides polygyrus TaxID=6339 RepID=A0A183FLV3_HELPZ|nr:unnamed protein product [Heligmosomoides polygyrus]
MATAFYCRAQSRFVELERKKRRKKVEKASSGSSEEGTPHLATTSPIPVTSLHRTGCRALLGRGLCEHRKQLPNDDDGRRGVGHSR